MNKHPAALMTRQIGRRLFKGEGSEENRHLQLLLPDTSGQRYHHGNGTRIVVRTRCAWHSVVVGADEVIRRSPSDCWSCGKHIRHPLVTIGVVLLSYRKAGLL